MHGEGGVLSGAKPGLVLVDMTTAEPASTLALAEALAAKGAVMVDGPVTLTPKEAEEGRLNIMIGAEAAILGRDQAGARDVLRAHLSHRSRSAARIR